MFINQREDLNNGLAFVNSNASIDAVHTSYQKQHVAPVSSSSNSSTSSSQLVADTDMGSGSRNTSSMTSTGTGVYYEMTSSLLGVYMPLSATLCPALLVAALTANTACALVFLRSRLFLARTARNARLYYLVLAAGDTLSVLSIPLPWFLGDGLHALSGGRVHWYAATTVEN